jgi:hypothetical protein
MLYVLPSEKSLYLWEDQSYKSYSPWNRAEVWKFTMVTLSIRLCASSHTDMNTIMLYNGHDIFENMPPFITKLNAEDVSRNYDKVMKRHIGFARQCGKDQYEHWMSQSV